MLRNLGFTAIPLHGQMSQAKRLGSLNKFKAKSRSLLIATDVASRFFFFIFHVSCDRWHVEYIVSFVDIRGLDIPHVDVVINLDIPTHSKDYIHRVGRTARAGRSGKSITFVTQYVFFVVYLPLVAPFSLVEFKTKMKSFAGMMLSCINELNI